MEIRVKRSSVDSAIIHREQQESVAKWLRSIARTRSDSGRLIFELPTGYRCGTPRREQRAIGDAPMTVSIGPSGGYLVAEQFSSVFEAAEQAFAPVMQVADVITTEKGGPLKIGLADDRANIGEVVAPNQVRDEAPFVCGQLVLQSFGISSKDIAIPMELALDANPGFLPFVYEILATRIYRTLGRLFTIGSGSGEPRGIATDTPVGVTAASAVAITDNELRALVVSVDAAYRTEFYNCGWMMNDTTRATLAGLKDGQGRVLFPELDGYWPRLLGYPVWINPSMADIAAGERPVIFGAMRRFKIRLVGEIVLRANTEMRAEYDQIVVDAFVRADSGIAAASATDQPIKCIQMAAARAGGTEGRNSYGSTDQQH